MPSFGAQSLSNLGQCHPFLVLVATEVIKRFDFKVLVGYRGPEEQEAAFAAGNSKAHYGESAHNYSPSYAFDLAPWPIDWKDIKRFTVLGALILHEAQSQKIELFWGAAIQGLFDVGHFELKGWRGYVGR